MHTITVRETVLQHLPAITGGVGVEPNKFYTVRGYQLLEQHKNELTPSLEDYLEMIYRSILATGYSRVSTLAEKLNVKPPSVSKMIIKLAEQGFIEYEKYGVIKLTKRGTEIGSYLLWRHNTITQFLSLMMPENSERNFEETELVEHILSRETVECLEKLVRFFTKESETLDRLLKK